MLATPDHQDSWFFDTGATHHLAILDSLMFNCTRLDQVTIIGHCKTLLKGWLRDGLMSFLLHHLLMLLCLQVPFLLDSVQFGILDLDTQLLFFPRL
ncbi:hypothetical protein AAG906_022176 [Vitis piasezkii]